MTEKERIKRKEVKETIKTLTEMICDQLELVNHNEFQIKGIKKDNGWTLSLKSRCKG